MKAVGNFIWIILGGIFLSLAWLVSGIIMYLCVIGIRWGRSCLVMARFALFPFGKEAISRKELSGEADAGTGGWGILANILWFPLGAILAILHMIAAIAKFCTIIGIPLGIQDLKLAGIALAPVGKTIVPKEVAEEARRRNAAAAVDTGRQAAEETQPIW